MCLYRNVLQIFIYSLYFCVLANSVAIQEKKPVITIVAASGYDYNHNYSDVLPQNATFARIPSNIRMCLLICNASYPVNWYIHDQTQVKDSWSLGFRTRRMVSNIFDASTFRYSAELNFYPHSENPWTGNYTCQSTVKPELQASKYLFWEGSNALLHAFKNITLYEDNDELLIPCVVTKLNTKPPVLQWKNRTVYQNLTMGKTVSYNGAKGFLLTPPSVLGGQYKCIIDGFHDWINFDVKIYNETFKPAGKNSNASFKYYPEKSTLECCSNSRRSPKLINFFCKHPSVCNYKNLFAVSAPIYYFMNSKSKRSCTKIRLYSHSPGIAHCLGDGIDMIKQYAFPMRYNRYYHPRNETLPAYFQWNEIVGQEMINLNYQYQPPRYNRYYYGYYGRPNTPQEQPEAAMYEGEILSFMCEPSPYYFSEGVYWGIKWKNQSVQIVNSSSDSTDGNINYFHGSYSSTVVRLHVDIESVICIAPVWNSTEYVFKPQHVYVNASKEPVMKTENLEESLTWTMNDTTRTIVCEAEGIPMPTFTWYKTIVQAWTYNTTIGENSNDANVTRVVNNVTNTISETYVFHRVSYDTQGMYYCIASNSVGSVARKVTIAVEEPSSLKKATAAIIGVVVVLILGIVLGILFVKMRVDKKVIKQLSAPIGFNNGSPANQEGIGADTDNTRFDIPKIHSNLIG